MYIPEKNTGHGRNLPMGMSICMFLYDPASGDWARTAFSQYEFRLNLRQGHDSGAAILSERKTWRWTHFNSSRAVSRNRSNG